MTSSLRGVRVEPATADRWDDLVELFGARGACGGCWCMTPRLSRRDYEAGKGDGNRAALQRLVQSGPVPGVLAYLGTTPIGWCSIEPRSRFVSLANSRILAPVDERPVWSIVCLFVRRDHRGRGVSRSLIEGAVRHARDQGARIVEAYPVIPKQRPMPNVFAYTGIASVFERCGFREVERRSPTRPIMRRVLRPSRSPAPAGGV